MQDSRGQTQLEKAYAVHDRNDPDNKWGSNPVPVKKAPSALAVQSNARNATNEGKKNVGTKPQLKEETERCGSCAIM